MKRLTHLSVSIFCLFIISCNIFDKTYERLKEADQLIEQNPDSAYNILNSISGADINTDEDSAYYGLLYSQSRYKLEKEVDTLLISKSIRYYQRHKLSALLQRSLFYYAAILKDNRSSDVHKIILNYKQAEQLINEVRDTLMTLRIYEALTSTYIKTANLKASLRYAKLEMQVAEQYSDKSWIASGLCLLSYAYVLNGETDSASIYIKMLESLVDKEEKNTKAKIYNNMAAFYLENGEEEELTKVEKYLHLSLDNDTLETTINMLSELYFMTGRDKEALDIYKNLLKSGTKGMRMYVYGILSEYYASQNNYEKAYEMNMLHNALYTEIEDSINQLNLNELLIKYDNEVIIRNYKAERGRLFSVISIVIIIILIISIFALRNMYKHKFVLEQYKGLLENVKYELSIQKKDNEKTLIEKKKQIEKILQTKRNSIAKLEKQLSIKDENLSSQVDKMENSIRLIFHLAKGDNFSQYDNKERENFIELYRVFDPNYIEKLDALNTTAKLTIQEKMYCILRHMNKSNESIQQMFCWSDEALRKTRSRAFNKLKNSIYTNDLADKI